MADTQFNNQGIIEPTKTLDDFFEIRGNVLLLKNILQTQNFIPNVKGVQIKPQGIDANGGTINPGNTLSVTQGGTGATTLTGILKGNGVGAITTVAGVSGSFYVASSSGGSPTHLVTVTNGVITAIA